ncbi:hypothetical protein PHMEG_00027858 [Phytophthora megakarya]|uniref:TKL protein kinase n=1 Tax=Phytophthora megakarya TaxID=4795 RepID=A0A225V5Y2_9STRA|nr:hypothetical protein PHMEG_00027858 [Phytophthora megakarya]
MRRCLVTTTLLLTVAVHTAASDVLVCSLPASVLYIANGRELVACNADNSSSTFSAQCQSACSCRRLEIAKNVYGLCLNNSATFDCDAAENATHCAQEAEVISTRTVDVARRLASGNGDDGLKAWQWALIGLAIAFVVGLLIFIFNWFKHRPERGDNRREVVQSLELSRSQPKDNVDMRPVAVRESQARTATTNRESAARSTARTHDSNPSQISGFSGASYHTYAGNPMSSTLTDTEIVTQHQERVFSPISDSVQSGGSSDYSQGVDTSTAPNTALLANSRAQGNSSDSDRPYRLDSYSSSGMDSFSSELTVDGSDVETAPYPRKKSIEF